MAAAMSVRECPVCLEAMTAPIFNCVAGHGLCAGCNARLPRPECPLCRAPMTSVRNRDLEAIVSESARVEARVECWNRTAGCVYRLRAAELEDHLAECSFREVPCPLGAVFGRCSWSGQLKMIMDHTKAVHPESVLSCSENSHTLSSVSAREDDRRVLVAAVGKCRFVLTFKVDTQQRMAYWSAQVIGNNTTAQQWIYEVQMWKDANPRQKVTFTDRCVSDQDNLQEVFKSCRCAALSADALTTFLQDHKLTYKFTLKRSGPPASNKNKNDNNGDDKRPPGPGARSDFKYKKGGKHGGARKQQMLNIKQAS